MVDRRQSWPVPQSDYHAYLLRLWRESPGGPWRAWLQDAATGERHGFVSLSAVMRFLWAQTEAHSPPESESITASAHDPGQDDPV